MKRSAFPFVCGRYTRLRECAPGAGNPASLDQTLVAHPKPSRGALFCQLVVNNLHGNYSLDLRRSASRHCSTPYHLTVGAVPGPSDR